RGGLGISTHDVIVQHIRVRPGEAGFAKKSGWEVDAIATSGADAYNIIVDHCSCSWATDENLSASGPRFDGDDVTQWRRGTSRKITFSNCIIAEGLSHSTHGKGEHSKGTLIHDNATKIAVIGNLYAHNRNRNPFFKGGARGIVVNNYIYNPSRRAAHYALVPSEWGDRPYVAGQMAVVGNVLEFGPTSRQGMSLLFLHRGGPCDVLLDDNIVIGPGNEDSPLLEVDSRAAPDLCRIVEKAPLWPPELVALPAKYVKNHVLENAGARPWDRDKVDRRIVRQARRGEGKVIDSEKEVGGYPSVQPTHAAFDPRQWDFTDMTRGLAPDGRRNRESRPRKLRVVIETDAPGGDPDDEGSLVRFFLYLNEWDVEGLVGTRPAALSRLQTSGKNRILQYVNAYELIYENLRAHSAGFPTPNYLRSITRQCHQGSEGRDHVISVIDRDDPREIWYLNWGTNERDDVPTALRQALDHVKQTRTAAEYARFAGKIRYVEVYKQNHLGPHRAALGYYMDTFWPDMDGGRWYHRWRPLTRRAGGFDVKRDIQTDHGPLCANYTIQKEGDTHTFTHLIPNGLNVPGRPEWGGWAGRYRYNQDLSMWWCDRRDTWQGATNRDNTLKPWVSHIQNDFRARADWCLAQTFAQANHPPRPYLQSDGSRNVLRIDACAGSTVSLAATGSTDP
ncbi:MAG: nucleoside hydrolase-like domain-containing protein, partial [Planctomycetota bacterium]